MSEAHRCFPGAGNATGNKSGLCVCYLQEYDAAHDRGEVKAPNNSKTTSNVEAVSASDIGLSHKEIHEARAAIAATPQ